MLFRSLLGNEQPTSALSGLVEAINQNMQQLVGIQNAQNQQIIERQAAMIEQLNRPKQVMRDINGKIIGVQ